MDGGFVAAVVTSSVTIAGAIGGGFWILSSKIGKLEGGIKGLSDTMNSEVRGIKDTMKTAHEGIQQLMEAQGQRVKRLEDAENGRRAKRRK